MTNLLDLDYEHLVSFIETFGEKPYRAKQLMHWIYQESLIDFNEMTDISKVFREVLIDKTTIQFPSIMSDAMSDDGTRKWLFDVGGNNGIETVFIPEDDRGTLCISSQVGCALECTFCSTGRQGFNRNLTTAEIIGQLWLANFHIRQQEAEGFYAVHKDRPFFKDLVSFMISGPVMIQALEGENAVLKHRDLMGATNPEEAAPGTIRADFAESIDANAVHGSDSLDNAKIEIKYFFG